MAHKERVTVAVTAKLDGALDRALERLRSGTESDHGLGAVIEALAAVSDFVTAVAPSSGRKYTRVHMVLLAALLDNAKGANVPMLARGSIPPGQPPESLGVLQVHVHAAATVQSLMDSGFPLKSMEGKRDATSLVVNTLSKCGHIVTARTVASWRDKHKGSNEFQVIYAAGTNKIVNEVFLQSTRNTGKKVITLSDTPDEIRNKIRDRLLKNLASVVRLWNANA
jgi:hypothetical protein